MSFELDAEENNTLRTGAKYAFFLAETGEQLCDWVYPDENGEIPLLLSEATETYDVEIGMLLEDGTLMLGHRTTIEVDD